MTDPVPGPGHTRAHIARLFSARSPAELKTRLAPKSHPAPPRVPSQGEPAARWDALPLPPTARGDLLDAWTEERAARYEHNVENLIGTVKVPVGLVGPMRVNGLFAQGDFYVPLATTEAALVASYNRGARILTACGGASAMLLVESVNRSPGFAFGTLAEAGEFVVWALSNVETFRKVAEATTRHGKLIDMRVTVEGNHVYLNFEYHTGDASGQNMVTIATEAVHQHILAHAPVKPRYSFVEANLSGDKKASAVSFLLVRGRKVSAEVVVPRQLVVDVLHTTPERMVDYWRMSAVGGVLSGTMGVQGHYANALAALYLACGQDVACVAESAVGVTRYELTAEGDLYASVTLPNIMVGTVGGGTALPSQKDCLDILGLAGAGRSQALAEVAATICLAGELSIVGAFCAGHFAAAHQRLARGA